MSLIRFGLVSSLLLLLASCGRSLPGTAALGESCVQNADCAHRLVCTDGRCLPEAVLRCEAGDRRCNADVLLECAELGDAWDVVQSCPHGCADGQCLPAECTAGAWRCDQTALLQCLPNGLGWAFVRTCASGCDEQNGTCLEAECTPFETRCRSGAQDVVQTCNTNGTAWVDAPCADVLGGPAVCAVGRCQPKTCETARENGVIVDRQTRCRGDLLESCNDHGTDYALTATCAFGCQSAEGVARCADAACEPGEETCDGDAVVRCRSDQRGFAFLRHCPAGCEVEGGTGVCLAPTCTPFARRCGADGQTGQVYVDQCSPDGSGWTRVESCEQACSSGTCVLSEAGCTAGELRCQGRDAQECVRLSSGGSQWRLVERCLGQCNWGACDDAGSCGCVDESTELACGSPSRPLVTIEALTDGGALHADSVSTVLLYTEPIVSDEGRPVPDGTLVTFTHDGTGALFASADADDALAGLQRPTLGGRARVLLRAPSSAGTVTVRATVAGPCAGTLELPFAPVTAGRSVLVSEDFSTTGLVDNAATTVQIDTTIGRARGLLPLEHGTGRDGDLVVPMGQILDLWEERIGRAWDVQRFTSREAVLGATPERLAPGDEVLLLALTGNTAAVGNHEFRYVAAVEGNRVIFTEPVERLYGASTNADLTGNRVVIQRVAHLRNLTVEAGATFLRTRSVSQGGTGTIALRVQGTAQVNGQINVSNLGLPAGSVQNATTTPSLDKLLLGRGGTSASGGGIIFLAAAQLKVNYGIISASANGTVSGGGTVWLQAGHLEIVKGPSDPPRIQAAAQDQGAVNGRVRVDFARLVAAGVADCSAGEVTCSVANPAAFVGFAGPLLFQTTPAYEESAGSGRRIRSARLTGAIAGPGAGAIGVPGGGLPAGLRFEVDGDDGGGWTTLSGGLPATFNPAPGAGRRLRFRVFFEAFNPAPPDLLGASFRVESN